MTKAENKPGKTCQEIHDMIYGEDPVSNPVTRSVYLQILANRAVYLEKRVDQLTEKSEEKDTKTGHC